jgi:hypothetical protein
MHFRGPAVPFRETNCTLDYQLYCLGGPTLQDQEELILYFSINKNFLFYYAVYYALGTYKPV